MRKKSKKVLKVKPVKRVIRDSEERDRKYRTCVLLAQYTSTRKTAEIIGEEYDFSISHQAVAQFAKRAKWRKVISYIRNKMLNKLARIPCYHEAVRLLRYEKIYEEAMTESLKSVNQYGEIYELNLSAALKAMENARDEVKGKGSSLVLGDNNKLILQDITIEGLTYEQKVKRVNARLSTQFG